jgi:hypothetical protein
MVARSQQAKSWELRGDEPGAALARSRKKDLDEMVAGGLHVTPRYRELAEEGERLCFKVMTGKDLN